MPQSLKAPQFLSVAGVLVWALYFLSDYFSGHGRMLSDALALPYYGPLLLLVLIAGGVFYVGKGKISSKEQTGWSIGFRGVTLFAGVLIYSLVLLTAFLLKGLLGEAEIGSRLFYFVGYAVVQAFGVLLIVTSAYSAGSWLLNRYRSLMPGSYQLVSVAVGFSLLGSVLVLLGVLNLYISVVAWAVISLPIALRYQHAFSFLRGSVWELRTATFNRTWGPPLVVITLACLGVNLVGGLKTFPVGFDGAALYLNLSMLAADMGSLPNGNAAYGWSVFMALGEVLYGSLTIGILLSNVMGLLVLLLVYHIARRVLSTEMSWLVVLLTLTVPFFTFHWLVDEKIDLAFTFFALSIFELAGVLGSSLAVKVTQPAAALSSGQDRVDGPQPTPTRHLLGLWAILGFLLGFAFTIKYTALILGMALFCYWLYRLYGQYAFAGGALLSVGFVFLSGIYRLGIIAMPRVESIAFGAALSVLGVAAIFMGSRKRNATGGALLFKGLGVALGMVLLAFTPWGIKNVAENGRLAPGAIIRGQSLRPDLEYLDAYSLFEQSGVPPLEFTSPWGADQAGFQFTGQTPTPQLPDRPTQEAGDENGANQVAEGAREDVQRYLGYEQDLWRYLSLPYDLSINKNLGGKRFVEIGFLGMLLLPVLLLFSPAPKKIALARMGWLAIIAVYLAGVLAALYLTESPDGLGNAEALLNNYTAGRGAGVWTSVFRALWWPIAAVGSALSGVYDLLAGLPPSLTFSIIIGAGLLAILGAKQRLAGTDPTVRQYGAFVGAYALLFWIMGSGVPWYAMPVFVLAPIIYCYYLDAPERLLGRDLRGFSKSLAVVALGGAVLFQVALHFTSPFENEDRPEVLFRPPFVNMATSHGVGQREVQAAFGPVDNDIIDALNEDRTTLVYQVGTQLGHFIAENNRRVFSDPVLVRFNDITSRLAEDRQDQFIDMLKAQGYRYILLDLGLGETDRTPEQTLKRKFINFARLLLGTPKVKAIVTDNLVEDSTGPYSAKVNGKEIRARFGVDGKTVRRGATILFEIQ